MVFIETVVGSRGEETEDRKVNFVVDTLVVADEIVGGFRMPGAEVFTLGSNDGFGKILALLRLERLKVQGFKFVVFLCGKLDLLETNRCFNESVLGVVEWFQANAPTVLLVFTASVPLPTDTRFQIKMSSYRAGRLSRLAEEFSNVEFSRPGKRLLKPGGVVPECYDETGRVNCFGLLQLQKGLEAKFTCAQLRQKQMEL